MPEPRGEFPKGEEVEVVARDSRWHGHKGPVQHRSTTTGMVNVEGLPYAIHERYLRFTTPAVEAKPDKPVRLVGVTGRKRAGKDTFAKRLVDQHGFTRMAFADNVRKVALAIDPIIGWVDGPVRLSTLVGLGGWEPAKEFPEVRRILQRIGTEGIRSLQPDFWIRQVLDHMPDGPVVITDVRFPNEADAIKMAGGVVIRVNRPGLFSDDQHSSESAMDNYRYNEIVQNEGTVKDLYATVDKWVADGFPTV